MLKLKILGLFLVVVVYLLQIWIYSAKQPSTASGNGRGDDGVFYGRMAEQIVGHQPIEGPAPFVYRIGGPWIAAQYAKALSVSIDSAFQQVNGIMLVILLSLVYWAALDFCSPLVAAIATCLYSLPYWSYTRVLFFCPVMGSDVPFMITMMLGLRQLVWWHASPPRKAQICIFSLLCLLAPIMRETGMILPILFLCSRSWIRRHLSLEVVLGDPPLKSPSWSKNVKTEVMLSLLFCLLSCLGLLITRIFAINDGQYLFAENKPYTFVRAIVLSVQLNSIWHFITCLCLAYGGPLIALIVLYHRYLREKMRATPVLVVYGGGCWC